MESNLNLRKIDIEAEIGVFMGWGRGTEFSETAWDASQTAFIDRAVKSGLRRVYFPALPDGRTYEWSWRRPIASLTLASGATTVDLPDDFGGLEGQIIVSTSSTSYPPVDVYNPEKVAQLHADDSTTGYPKVASIQYSRKLALNEGQRANLYVWPTADAAYTLQVGYYFQPNALDGSRPYAYGGVELTECILASCLAIAEQRGDDSLAVNAMDFQRLLVAAVHADKTKKQQVYGYNRDRSDMAHWGRRMTEDPQVLFNGLVWD